MLKSFVVTAFREAFKESEFLDRIAGAIVDRIRNSAAVNSAVTEINRRIDRLDGVLNDNSPTTYFARRLVLAQVEKLAETEPKVATALSAYENYGAEVLDGVTIDEILTVQTPLEEVIKSRAIAIADRLQARL